MKALVVAEPWIGLILSGRKTWELRSRRTQHRGPFALIRKGSGTVVAVAELVACLPPLSAASMATTMAHHLIPPEDQSSAVDAGWVVPWCLRGVRAVPPIRYQHPPGAVTWVRLDVPTSTRVLNEAHLGTFDENAHAHMRASAWSGSA